MNGELILQKSIGNRVDYIARHGCGLWLHNVLERGFDGYANMSDGQLLLEIRRRGLWCEFENKPWPLDEEDDDEFDTDDEELQQLLGDRVTGDMRMN